jgi:hypothetical protein
LKDKKFCNFIVSSSWGEPIREKVFLKLNDYKKVDSGGKLFNNINIPTTGRGWDHDKLDFMKSYKFSLVFENSSVPGYTTEKILHAFYAQTIPIYWGSPTIASDFNTNSFINVHDFGSMSEVMYFIQKLDEDEDLYNRFLNSPKLAGGVPRDYMILNNFLNWFDSVVYNKIDMRT